MRVRKLLVIHQGALGDFVLTFPALIKLKAAYSRIDVLCQHKLAEIARALDLIDNGYALESGAFASLYADHFSKVDPKVKKMLIAYDDIILFSFSRQLAAMLSILATTKIHCIPPRPAPHETIHVAAFIIQQLKAVDLLPAAGSADNHFTVRPPAHGLHASRVLLHPGSGSQKKNWPVSNFIKLAEILRKKGQCPEFILGPAEVDLYQELIQKVPDEIKIHMVSDLKRVLELINQAGAIIGNDSGISHLAAFTGIPTVAIFGPSDPRTWRPIGRAVAVVSVEFECAPCLADDQRGCLDKGCLEAVTAEMVAAALARLVDRSP